MYFPSITILPFYNHASSVTGNSEADDSTRATRSRTDVEEEEEQEHLGSLCAGDTLSVQGECLEVLLVDRFLNTVTAMGDNKHVRMLYASDLRQTKPGALLWFDILAVDMIFV